MPKSDSRPTSLYSTLRQPLLIAIQGTAFGIYGYAIAWQLIHPQPSTELFGHFRFLTFQCLCIQFASYGLCLNTNFFPQLTKVRDYVITTIAYPVSLMVFINFWPVYFYDRELILPIKLELDGTFPIWLNHVSHTIIFPINLLQLALERHQYPSPKASLLGLYSYTSFYTSILLIHRYNSGHYVYSFLDKLSTPVIAGFIAASLVSAGLFYYSGRVFCSFFRLAPIATKRKKPMVKMITKSV